jgi:hypothetical protein
MSLSISCTRIGLMGLICCSFLMSLPLQVAADDPLDTKKKEVPAAGGRELDVRNWFDAVTGQSRANAVRGQTAVKGLTANVSHPAHPILIRNEHGSLLHIVVEVEKRDDVRATSLVLNLDGTDDLGDLESLNLFATGDKEEFSASMGLGTSVVPAAEITFRFDQLLRPGKNIFWLSGRKTSRRDSIRHQQLRPCKVGSGHGDAATTLD